MALFNLSLHQNDQAVMLQLLPTHEPGSAGGHAATHADAVIHSGMWCVAEKAINLCKRHAAMQAVRLQPADAALERDLARLEAAERPTDLDAVRHAALACCKCQVTQCLYSPPPASFPPPPPYTPTDTSLA